MARIIKTILSLCDFTGNWSRPYTEDDDYEVIQVDLKLGRDIRTLMKLPRKVHGILMAPPCTVFAGSGARWERSREEMLEGLSLVDACLRQAIIHQPAWWVLENPVGKLVRYIGEPVCYIQPWYYGDSYNKKTGLWGNFVLPDPTKVVQPSGKRHGQPDAWYSSVGGKSGHTKAVRATTPMGFAYAFKEVNP